MGSHRAVGDEIGEGAGRIGLAEAGGSCAWCACVIVHGQHIVERDRCAAVNPRVAWHTRVGMHCEINVGRDHPVPARERTGAHVGEGRHRVEARPHRLVLGRRFRTELVGEGLLLLGAQAGPRDVSVALGEGIALGGVAQQGMGVEIVLGQRASEGQGVS